MIFLNQEKHRYLVSMFEWEANRYADLRKTKQFTSYVIRCIDYMYRECSRMVKEDSKSFTAIYSDYIRYKHINKNAGNKMSCKISMMLPLKQKNRIDFISQALYHARANNIIRFALWYVDNKNLFLDAFPTLKEN